MFKKTFKGGVRAAYPYIVHCRAAPGSIDTREGR